MFAHLKNLPAVFGMSLALLLSACDSLSTQSSSAPDWRYVKSGDTNGYYLVRSSSPMRDKLGFGDAPVSSTGDELHSGRGMDVIAFRFNERGVLASAPAYIYQAAPEDFYSERLRGISIGKSTLEDVKTLFPGANLLREHGGSLVYLMFRVRNPAERQP